MVTSISDLCALDAAPSALVVQADRRQTTDRRKTRRGGRRADDVNAAVEALDLRAIAMRRAAANSAPSTADQHDAEYVLATPSGRILE